MPAGGPETLKVAVDYGADAIYMGGSKFGLRAKADNFNEEEMREGISYAHQHGVKVYLTVNIFAHNDDVEGLKEYFETIRDIGVDAVLIADPGVFSLARSIMPDMEIHISTQANNTNFMTYRFWHDLGVKRVVCARELSLKEIRTIRQNIPDDLEIEAFVHGAMCISYSGRCLLSNYFTGRDANKGACTHPCRWKYAVMEETRPGEYLPVEEDERGTYIFNSKDLCMIEHIPDLIDAGIQSLKVEGRMKTSLYVAVAARTYREAIDDYMKDPELYASKIEHYKEEISACTMRDFTTGFYYGKPTYEDQIYDNNTYIRNAVYLGTVEEVLDGNEENGIEETKVDISGIEKSKVETPGIEKSEIEKSEIEKSGGTEIVITQKNKFLRGDRIEVMMFDGTNKEVTVTAIRDEFGNDMESAPHPKQKLFISLSDSDGIMPGMILRANS